MVTAKVLGKSDLYPRSKSRKRKQELQRRGLAYHGSDSDNPTTVRRVLETQGNKISFDCQDKEQGTPSPSKVKSQQPRSTKQHATKSPQYHRGETNLHAPLRPRYESDHIDHSKRTERNGWYMWSISDQLNTIGRTQDSENHDKIRVPLGSCSEWKESLDKWDNRVAERRCRPTRHG
ncbi:hypothetical protein PHISCL_07845 [Aspergillus sclerotialis]|uniref:Uncharacterized protein n=1 Tax=Aspergillus sclerotialis TaxID=2070753 RepID=A0A3A2ZKC2_9EURO|nr:hypothetical protein PHISCL_07845 [Aspergillus sclerotialis]